MNWDRYYEKYKHSGTTIYDQYEQYQEAISKLSLGNARVAVLGGFSSNTSLEAFNQLALNSFPNARTFALDLHQTPLRQAPKDQPTRLLQADLNTPPFAGNVDLLILDYTLNYMNDPYKFLQSPATAGILSPKGAILATVVDTTEAFPHTKLYFWLKKKIYKDPLTRYDPAMLFKNTGDLEIKSERVSESRDIYLHLVALGAKTKRIA